MESSHLYEIVMNHIPIEHIQFKFHIDINIIYHVILHRLKENHFHPQSLYDFRKSLRFNFSLESILNDCNILITIIPLKERQHFHSICLTITVLLIRIYNPSILISKYDQNSFMEVYGNVEHVFDPMLMLYANVCNQVASLLSPKANKIRIMIIAGFIVEGSQYLYLQGGNPSKKKQLQSLIYHTELQIKKQQRKTISKLLLCILCIIYINIYKTKTIIIIYIFIIERKMITNNQLMNSDTTEIIAIDHEEGHNKNIKLDGNDNNDDDYNDFEEIMLMWNISNIDNNNNETSLNYDEVNNSEVICETTSGSSTSATL
jgi:hypothetical protein